MRIFDRYITNGTDIINKPNGVSILRKTVPCKIIRICQVGRHEGYHIWNSEILLDSRDVFNRLKIAIHRDRCYNPITFAAKLTMPTSAAQT